RQIAGPPHDAGLTSRDSPVALLPDPGRLARELAEVVELRATDAPAAHDVDRRPDRRVEREHPLDADTRGDLADGERLADPATAPGDHDALEGLQAGLVALAHAHHHLDGVAGVELRDVVA